MVNISKLSVKRGVGPRNGSTRKLLYLCVLVLLISSIVVVQFVTTTNGNDNTEDDGQTSLVNSDITNTRTGDHQDESIVGDDVVKQVKIDEHITSSTGSTGSSIIREIRTIPLLDVADINKSSSVVLKSSSQAHTRYTYLPIVQLAISELLHPKNDKLRTKPLLLTGWDQYQTSSNPNSDPPNIPNNNKLSTILQRSNFIDKFGNYTIYIKDEFVQPLATKKHDKCFTVAYSLLELMNMNSNLLSSTFDSSPSSSSSSSTINTKDEGQNLLFFTNNHESPHFFQALQQFYTTPLPIDFTKSSSSRNTQEQESLSDQEQQESSSFHVFSAMVRGSYHSFHYHAEAQITQLHGRKMWWFLPPGSNPPKRANPCQYLTTTDTTTTTTNNNNNQQQQQHDHDSSNMISILQQPGDTIYIPKDWYHATCALDDWVVAVGMQRGNVKTNNQGFDILPQPFVIDDLQPKEQHVIDELIHPMPWTKEKAKDIQDPNKDKDDAVALGGVYQRHLIECGIKFNWDDPHSWKWFQGDLNKYYNKLISSDSKRNPNNIASYAVHRWMGKERSTLIHYQHIYQSIQQSIPDAVDQSLNVLDAGCGLGAGLMWFEKFGPKRWNLFGHTISTAQLDFIHKLPSHDFQAVLRSYDELDAFRADAKGTLDVIYSIEAFIHSPDERNTLNMWSNALADGGIIVLIDDFLSVGTDKDAEDVQFFAKSWMANVLQTTSSLTEIAEQFQLDLIVDRDLGSEYQVNKRNYGNTAGEIRPTEAKNHQGWLGSGLRRKLMIEGKITYRLVVFQKQGTSSSSSKSTSLAISDTKKTKKECISVPFQSSDLPDYVPIMADHKTGEGTDGGNTQKCISGWYCCGQGLSYWENLEANRTSNTAYLKLPKSLFGHTYMDKFVEHLNAFYRKIPKGSKGTFLDIGGTGSVSSGMTKVTSKFAHFSGPFDYWLLDSDPVAKNIENALHCDMADCPQASDCSFDVTFSHTVIEHSPRPWLVFDEIARITKKGGLTLHIVPFSYQYHATPDDNYRFSHKALTSLMEDRGFRVLDVGYDICTKPEKVLREKVDEHFDVIWLTYVIGQKI